MIWVKNLNFFYSLFLCKLRLKMTFGDLLDIKEAFLDYTNIQFLKFQIGHFSKGLINP